VRDAMARNQSAVWRRPTRSSFAARIADCGAGVTRSARWRPQSERVAHWSTDTIRISDSDSAQNPVGSRGSDQPSPTPGRPIQAAESGHRLGIALVSWGGFAVRVRACTARAEVEAALSLRDGGEPLCRSIRTNPRAAARTHAQTSACTDRFIHEQSVRPRSMRRPVLLRPGPAEPPAQPHQNFSACALSTGPAVSARPEPEQLGQVGPGPARPGPAQRG
jgi:hypothetical protein